MARSETLKTFLLTTEINEIIRILDDAEKGRLFQAVLDYAEQRKVCDYSEEEKQIIANWKKNGESINAQIVEDNITIRLSDIPPDFMDNLSETSKAIFSILASRIDENKRSYEITCLLQSIRASALRKKEKE